MENDNGDVDDDDIEQDEFCIGDELGTVLDQYLGIEELEKVILEEGNAFVMICHKEPHILMSSMIFNTKH